MSNLEFSGIDPKPEYLLQYPVERVLTKEDESGWAIEFQGGAILGVESDETPIPDLKLEEGVQVTLLRALYSQTETRLHFGKMRQVVGGANELYDEVEITVRPGDYFIIDPRFPNPGTHYPGMTAREDATARRQTAEELDWNALRTQEGPQELEGGPEPVSEDDGA